MPRGKVLGDYASWQCNADGPVSSSGGLEDGRWSRGVHDSSI